MANNRSGHLFETGHTYCPALQPVCSGNASLGRDILHIASTTSNQTQRNDTHYSVPCAEHEDGEGDSYNPAHTTNRAQYF